MANEFRLLITGSRDWLDRQRIYGALDAILRLGDARREHHGNGCVEQHVCQDSEDESRDRVNSLEHLDGGETHKRVRGPGHDGAGLILHDQILPVTPHKYASAG